MTKTGIPYLDLTWSPCGFGCSKGCRTCWARKLAKRIGTNNGCPDCLAFRPHFHPERLDEPSRRRKPAVIGVDFYADLFDPSRDQDTVNLVLDAAKATTNMLQTFVFLTERYGRCINTIHRWHNRAGCLPPSNWWIGATIRNQADADTVAAEWADMPAKKWLSLEPLEGPVTADWNRITGSIIIGCDNDASVPWSNQWAVDVIDNFHGPVYVKQIRLADGRLTDNPTLYPPELRRREMPWTLTTKGILA